ncbi:MAG: hypothetical protein LBS72_06320 [Oscillospiraceae bacterium]|nr:hypothetical protein [Oscillospiraceae bacterium]
MKTAVKPSREPKPNPQRAPNKPAPFIAANDIQSTSLPLSYPAHMAHFYSLQANKLQSEPSLYADRLPSISVAQDVLQKLYAISGEAREIESIEG